MSRYYKAEDVIRAFKEWLAISEAAEDIIADLPTIDAISREHLKSFEYINKGDFNSVETIREWIDNAPSVIPQMPNEDAIGREELIKALIREKSDYLMAWNDAPTGMVKETCDELDKCIAIVINAPSVIPKPKEGEWIPDPDGGFKCSNCRAEEDEFIYGTGMRYVNGESEFCPNCGAKMKGAR